MLLENTLLNYLNLHSKLIINLFAFDSSEFSVVEEFVIINFGGCLSFFLVILFCFFHQSDAYNSTVHISINIGEDCIVNMEIDGAVNSQYHVSLNSPKNSQCTIKVDRAYNCTVHLR